MRHDFEQVIDSHRNTTRHVSKDNYLDEKVQPPQEASMLEQATMK